MPAVMERLIQKVKPDKWDELDKIDKKYNEIESKLGFPPKKRYRSAIGPLDNDVIVIEREWKSMAAMEESAFKVLTNPDLVKLGAELNTIIEKSWHELYMVWPLKV
nr:hypothetical protein [Candidatus Sigynarchaeota archaeon]